MHKTYASLKNICIKDYTGVGCGRNYMDGDGDLFVACASDPDLTCFEQGTYDFDLEAFLNGSGYDCANLKGNGFGCSFYFFFEELY